MKPVPVIVIAVIVGSIGFFCGMRYNSYQLIKTQAIRGERGQFAQGMGSASGQDRGIGAGRFGGMGGRIVGEIVSTDDTSITVKLPDGSSKIILLSSTTQVQKTSDAPKDELKTGTQIAAFGTANADGSVTAQTIQLNPQLGRAGGASQTPSASPTATPSPTSVK